MKKVTSKDLALKKETITSLSEATSEPAIITYNEDGCRKTFQSVCLCISENVHCKTENPQCGTNTCNASETQGPLCCGPIEETVNDACLFPMTNGTTCVQTMDKDCMVELSVENENGDYECNPVLLTENCPKETDNCEE